MKILVLNCGSSTLKLQLIETTPELIAANQDRLLAHGTIEQIGSAGAVVNFAALGRPMFKCTRSLLQHKDAIETAFECMAQADGVLAKPDEIEGVGHGIVHGGEHFRQSVIIDDEVVRKIESSIDLAPLHNPHSLKGYYASRALLPGGHARRIRCGLPPDASAQGLRVRPALPLLHPGQDPPLRISRHIAPLRVLSLRADSPFHAGRVTDRA